VHVPVFLALIHLLHWRIADRPLLLALVPAALGAAALFHRCIEAPAQRRGRALSLGRTSGSGCSRPAHSWPRRSTGE